MNTYDAKALERLREYLLQFGLYPDAIVPLAHAITVLRSSKATRQAEGIANAKARGVYRGRPATLDHAQVIRMHGHGRSAADIAAHVGCTRQSVYKILKEARSKSIIK